METIQRNEVACSATRRLMICLQTLKSPALIARHKLRERDRSEKQENVVCPCFPICFEGLALFKEDGIDAVNCEVTFKPHGCDALLGRPFRVSGCPAAIGLATILDQRQKAAVVGGSDLKCTFNGVSNFLKV